MRILLVLTLTAATALAAACGDSSPGRARNPIATFETRCKDLPAIPPEVVAAPLAVTEDTSRSRTDLTGANAHANLRHQTMGLTQTTVGYATTVDAEGLTDRAGRVCMRARIRVVLSMEPMTVFVARELVGDRCRFDAVRAHEQKHVDANEAFLSEMPKRLLARLTQANVDRVYYAASSAAAQHEIEWDVSRAVEAFQAAMRGDLSTHQAEIDTPAEYAAVSSACGGFPADGLAGTTDRR